MAREAFELAGGEKPVRVLRTAAWRASALNTSKSDRMEASIVGAPLSGAESCFAVLPESMLCARL